MTDYTAAEGGALVRIEVVTTELSTSHPADGVDEVGAVKVFKPVLVRVVGVGTTVEIIGRRILPTFLVTCIL